VDASGGGGAMKDDREQPEPVAYLWMNSETGATRVVMPDQIVSVDPAWHVVGPLYLKPYPKRKPLTDAEIDAVWGQLIQGWFNGTDTSVRHGFARAIERWITGGKE